MGGSGSGVSLQSKAPAGESSTAPGALAAARPEAPGGTLGPIRPRQRARTVSGSSSGGLSRFSATRGRGPSAPPPHTHTTTTPTLGWGQASSEPERELARQVSPHRSRRRRIGEEGLSAKFWEAKGVNWLIRRSSLPRLRRHPAPALSRPCTHRQAGRGSRPSRAAPRANERRWDSEARRAEAGLPESCCLRGRAPADDRGPPARREAILDDDGPTGAPRCRRKVAAFSSELVTVEANIIHCRGEFESLSQRFNDWEEGGEIEKRSDSTDRKSVV